MMADRNGLHGDAVVLAEGDRLVVDAMRKHPTHHKLQQVTTLTTFSLAAQPLSSLLACGASCTICRGSLPAVSVSLSCS